MGEVASHSHTSVIRWHSISESCPRTKLRRQNAEAGFVPLAETLASPIGTQKKKTLDRYERGPRPYHILASTTARASMRRDSHLLDSPLRAQTHTSQGRCVRSSASLGLYQVLLSSEVSGVPRWDRPGSTGRPPRSGLERGFEGCLPQTLAAPRRGGLLAGLRPIVAARASHGRPDLLLSEHHTHAGWGPGAASRRPPYVRQPSSSWLDDRL